MIKFISCPKCDFVNVVNQNVVDSRRESEKVFGFTEELTVLETDLTNCRKCGEWLAI